MAFRDETPAFGTSKMFENMRVINNVQRVAPERNAVPEIGGEDFRPGN
jgi:hypothetical protein